MAMSATGSDRPTSFRWAVVAAMVVLGACGTGHPGASSPVAATTPPTVSPTPLVQRTATPDPSAGPAVPTSAITEVALENGPNTIAMSADAVWVELHRDNIVASVDPATLEVTRHPDVEVHCTIASDGRNTVWAAHAHKSLLTRVDATTGEVTLELSIRDVCGVAAHGDQLWVASPSAGRVQRLDPLTGSPVLDVDVPDTPFGAIPVGDLVYASGEGRGGWLAAIDPQDGQVIATKTAPDVVMSDAIGLGFGSIWTVGRLEPLLQRLDPRTLESQGTVEVGSEPSGLVITDDAIWVTRLSGELYRIDPETMGITATWSTPYRFLAWPTLGFGRMWVTSLEGNVLVSVDLAVLEG